jgi:glycosyltransferase involved in cell wall biosynthesis
MDQNSGKRRISVIVPCRNELTHISAFLECLRNQSLPPELECEFLIADGMSDDGTREILEQFQREFGRIKLLDNLLQTVSCGLNEAIRCASGEIIIRMDVHSEYAPDYIQQCVATLDETGAANVGGPASPIGRSYFQRAISLAYMSRFSCGGARFHDPDYEGYVDTVTYGCWRKSTLEEIGLFDETLIRNQDDELNLRIVRSGGKIWQTPRIRSWYRPRSSLKSLARQYSQYGYWKVHVIRKHGAPASWRHLVPATFVAALLVLSIAAVVTPAARLFLVGLLAVYLLTAAVAAVMACRRTCDWLCVPILPLVFCVYHLSYGIGFWRGIWDLSIGQRPNPAFSALVR